MKIINESESTLLSIVFKKNSFAYTTFAATLLHYAVTILLKACPFVRRFQRSRRRVSTRRY